MMVAASENPYPGLRPFQADETHLFFGRDEQRIELLHRLRAARFLAIVGTSGSGKSSLVRAGLLPGLHGGFMAGHSASWRVVDLRPGTDPIGNLARALDEPGALRDTPRAADEPSFTEATLRRSGLGLVEAVREARLPPLEHVLVLADQFEELFRADEEALDRPRPGDDAAAFVQLLLEAARQQELPIYVVLTIRSDALGKCARFRGLPEAINGGQYLVPRLTPDQRIQAITGPAALHGVALASTLVNRLLNDVGDSPDQLPILQHALMRTWDHWQRRTAAAGGERSEIGLDDYRAIGGMEEALSRHADAVYGALGEGLAPDVGARRRTIAERLFKCLARQNAGALAERRLASLREIVDVTGAPAEEVGAVVDAFRAPGNSFLMPPPDEPLPLERHVDISHESLIRNWQRMKGWVEEEAESARVYERLASTAALHAKGEAALWDQPDLGVALKWRDRQQPNAAWARRYHPGFSQAMAFLDASQQRAQAAEDAKARRRRITIAGLAVLFFAMLTGILTWGRDELGRLQAMAQQATRTRGDLRVVNAIAATSARKDRSACSAASPAAAASAAPTPHDVLLRKLCSADSGLTADEDKLVVIDGQMVDGRWADAGKGIAQLGNEGAKEDARRLLGLWATLRTPQDRRERRELLELQEVAKKPRAVTEEPSKLPFDRTAVAARLVHPVNRRIATLLGAGEALSEEESLLLTAYAGAESRQLHDRRADMRKRGEEAAATLRRTPYGQPYADVADTALSPDSKVAEVYEIGLGVLRDYVWFLLLLMVWPVWRLRRLVQRRRGQPIPARPSPLRLMLAALVDFGVTAAIGIVTSVFVESALGIAAIVLPGADGLRDSAGTVAGVVGITAGGTYVLCRDYLRLRYRRSIGKVLFDLRPFSVRDTVPRPMGVWSSVRRNIVPPLFLLLLTSSWLLGLFALLVIPVLLIGGAVYLSWTWVKKRESLGSRWSMTRVLDSDSAGALAVRP